MIQTLIKNQPNQNIDVSGVLLPITDLAAASLIAGRLTLPDAVTIDVRCDPSTPVVGGVSQVHVFMSDDGVTEAATIFEGCALSAGVGGQITIPNPPRFIGARAFGAKFPNSSEGGSPIANVAVLNQLASAVTRALWGAGVADGPFTSPRQNSYTVAPAAGGAVNALASFYHPGGLINLIATATAATNAAQLELLRDDDHTKAAGGKVIAGMGALAAATAGIYPAVLASGNMLLPPGWYYVTVSVAAPGPSITVTTRLP